MKEVTITLSDERAWTLALFLKRVTWSDMRGCAVNDDETYEIKDAIEAVEKELRRQGYAPR